MVIYNRTGEASNGMAVLPNTFRRNMAENRRLCAICQNEYHPIRPTDWFCNKCYHLWFKEIHDREPWVKFCISSELGRRRQLRNQAKARFLFLGDKWDIDNDGNLIVRDGYNG